MKPRTVRLLDATWEDLDEYAYQHRTTVSAVVREVVECFVDSTVRRGSRKTSSGKRSTP